MMKTKVLSFVIANVKFTLTGVISADRQRDRTQMFAQEVLRSLSIRVKSDINERVLSSTLLVANHASYLDPFVLASLVPGLSFVVDRNFLMGLGSRLWGSGSDLIIIDKWSIGGVREMVDQIASQLRGGRVVALFPSVRASGSTVHGFASAGFQAAIDANCQVTPIAIKATDGGSFYNWTARGSRSSWSILAHLRNLIRTDSMCVEVRIGESIAPIYTRRVLADATRQSICRLLSLTAT